MIVDIAERTPDDVRTAAVNAVSTPVAAAVAAAVSRSESAQGAADAPEARQKTSAGAVEYPAAMPDEEAGAAAASPSGSSDVAARGDISDTGGRRPDADSKEPEPNTDPHLGEHLSAEVLREELSTRPHELVGAAAAAAESGSIPTIAGRTVARRAATVLTHKSEQAREEAEEYRAAPRARRWVTISVAAAIVAVLAAGLWLGYAWTQTRYYIGEHDQHVAIFNGVSQRLGPIQLSTLETVTEIRMSDLPEFSQQRVRQTVPARDLYDAQRIVKNLELTGTTSPAEECLTPSPVPSPGSAAATPGGPEASSTSAPTASPAPTTATTCEAGK